MSYEGGDVLTVEKTNNFILLTEFEPRERVAEGIVTFGLFGVLRKNVFLHKETKMHHLQTKRKGTG